MMNFPCERFIGYERIQVRGRTCLAWSRYRHQSASVLCVTRLEFSESYSQKCGGCTGELWDPRPSADPPKEV